MKVKGRIIEVGSDGHHPVVTIHVENIDDVRNLGRHLYEYVEIEVGPMTCYSRPDANIDTLVCPKGHGYPAKSQRASLLIKHGLCWICQEEMMREELGP